MSLTPKQKRFCEEYLVDLNGTQAAIRAGYSKKTAKEIASENFSKPNIQEYLAERMRERGEKLDITAEKVLKQWWDIANADPNEIIQFRKTACRHCHGIDHQYQWADENEFSVSLIKAKEKSVKPLPNDKGGYGFRRSLDPHADCPRCDGEGVADVYGLDTRHLSPAARLLYAGVKVTQNGFEIKMRDQDKALENVARHLGMFLERHIHTGADGGAIVNEIILRGVRPGEVAAQDED